MQYNYFNILFNEYGFGKNVSQEELNTLKVLIRKFFKNTFFLQKIDNENFLIKSNKHLKYNVKVTPTSIDITHHESNHTIISENTCSILYQNDKIITKYNEVLNSNILFFEEEISTSSKYCLIYKANILGYDKEAYEYIYNKINYLDLPTYSLIEPDLKRRVEVYANDEIINFKEIDAFYEDCIINYSYNCLSNNTLPLTTTKALKIANAYLLKRNYFSELKDDLNNSYNILERIKK